MIAVTSEARVGNIKENEAPFIRIEATGMYILKEPVCFQFYLRKYHDFRFNNRIID